MFEYDPRETTVAYQVQFRRPAFDVVRSGLDVLQTLQRVLSEKYIVRSSDLKIYPAVTLSDFKIAIALFNGNATGELTPDQLSLNFANVSGPPDLEVVEECIRTTLSAVSSLIKEDEFARENLRVSSTFVLRDGVKALNSVLASFRQTLHDIQWESDEPVKAYPLYKIEIENEALGSITSVEVGKRWSSNESLFVSVSAHSYKQPTPSAFSSRVLVLKDTVASVFAKLQLGTIKTTPTPSKSGKR